ncbi:MAG: DNA polymerase III subunit delta [Patescibacteria group bacterium]|nr:DNA polymerase III subunit delta [Patescibacteria group bacterium]
MIIYLYGQDDFRIHQDLQTIKNKFLKQVDQSGLNFSYLDGSDLKIDQFRQAVLVSGFLAKKRMVVIKNLLTTGRDENLITEILTNFKKLEQQEDVVIIFIQTDELKNIRTQVKKDLLNKLVKSQYAKEFKLLKNKDLINWIKKEVSQLKAKIEPTAIELLINYLGNDLWKINNEIHKLVAYKSGQIIQSVDVELMVKADLDENIFNLTDAIANQNKKQSLKLIQQQLTDSGAWLRILNMISYQFRNLIILKSYLNEHGYSNQYGLAKGLGLHPFIIQKSLNQVDKYSLPQLKKIYHQLLEIDLQMKTKSLNPEVLLDKLVVEN